MHLKANSACVRHCSTPSEPPKRKACFSNTDCLPVEYQLILNMLRVWNPLMKGYLYIYMWGNCRVEKVVLVNLGQDIMTFPPPPPFI